MSNQKKLYDPSRHPEWIQPHSNQWYAQLGTKLGEYKYPWKSSFDKPTAAMMLTQMISSYIKEDSRILDVGCGHGEFTYQWASKVKEVVGIDVVKDFISTANQHKRANSIHFLKVDANGKLPFPNKYFDIVYTKKGPWLHQEAHRITKTGGIVIGLYHGGTDGGLREIFPGLFHPMADPYDLELLENKFGFKESIGLTDFKIRVVEEVEYLSTPEDVLIKKCFGQSTAVKEVVWKECQHDVADIFHKNASQKGLKVINYHHIVTAKVM